jgi:hypothetical protein
MNRLGRIALVLGGYAVALLAATAAVAVWQMRTSGPDVQAMAGMYAFGDFAHFVGVFGVLALVPTGFGLYFLRSCGKFWAPLSVVSLAIAMTSPVGVSIVPLAHVLRLRGPGWEIAGGLGFLRAMGAPLLAGGFFVGALVAPARRPRRALVAAACLELAGALGVAIHFIMMRVNYGLFG